MLILTRRPGEAIRIGDNIRLVAVVLDSDQMWDDSKALLNFGFSKLRPVELFKKGDILKTGAMRDAYEMGKHI